jgi:hypothetical protein
MTPSRARTLPHDYLAKVAKRNSMPDPNGQPAMPNPHLVNLNSPVVSSPLNNQPFDYSPSQMGQTQIPDLKNVMFPSDNPFAYPNQPISTLEGVDARYGFTDAPMDSPFTGSNENSASMLGTPASIPSQPHLPITSNPEQRSHGQQAPQLDMATLQRLYEEHPQLATHLAQQRHFAGQGGPVPFMQDQGSSSQQQMFDMPGGIPEDYWNQQNKPSRTGFTPGGNVNLDELFGGGDGWGATAGMWDSQGFPRQ